MLAPLQQIHERSRYPAATQFQEEQHARRSDMGLSSRGQDNRTPMRETTGTVMGEQTGHSGPVEDGVQVLVVHVFAGPPRAWQQLPSRPVADEESQRRRTQEESEQKARDNSSTWTPQDRFHDCLEQGMRYGVRAMVRGACGDVGLHGTRNETERRPLQNQTVDKACMGQGQDLDANYARWRSL